jgi:DNA-binding PadR family transcriptional regulator
MNEMMFEDGPGWRFAGRGRMGAGRFRGGRGHGGGPFGPGGGGEPHGRGRGRGGWRELFDERPPRADRGAVRFLVLDALGDTARHGYEIMAAIEAKSHGSYRPSPGVVYPTLQLLEELGHVRVTARDDKKVYAITASGTRELAEHADEVTSFYDQAEGIWDDHADELAELALLVRRVLRTFRRSARRGRLTPATMSKIRTILDDTVRQLESLLGDK